MEVTRNILSQRSGLSAVYLKKLERDSRPMSQAAAMALAAATGVDFFWLMGKGRVYPIRARFGHWTKETADALQKRKRDKRATREDAIHCRRWFLINADRMARVIVAGFKKHRAMLALARIHAAMDGLAKEFGVQPEPVKFGGKRIIRAAAETAKRLSDQLDADINQRSFD